MIKHKDKTFEQWSICPATGDIFDAETGEVQLVKIWRGRPYFRGKPVHQIMAHTFYGYKPGYDVHHKDENPLINSLDNLIYLTHGEHKRLHATALEGKLSKETRLKISEALKGKHPSEETRAKLSESHKGKPSPNKGKRLSEETRLKISAARKGKTTWNKDKHHSAETKAKISASMKGKNKGKKRTALEV